MKTENYTPDPLTIPLMHLYMSLSKRVKRIKVMGEELETITRKSKWIEESIYNLEMTNIGHGDITARRVQQTAPKIWNKTLNCILTILSCHNAKMPEFISKQLEALSKTLDTIRGIPYTGDTRHAFNSLYILDETLSVIEEKLGAAHVYYTNDYYYSLKKRLEDVRLANTLTQVLKGILGYELWLWMTDDKQADFLTDARHDIDGYLQNPDDECHAPRLEQYAKLYIPRNQWKKQK